MFSYKSNAFSFTFLHVMVMNDLQNLIEGGVNKQWGRENSPETNRWGHHLLEAIEYLHNDNTQVLDKKFSLTK